jgi:membrane protein YdbS with pleckstrin-like domain
LYRKLLPPVLPPARWGRGGADNLPPHSGGGAGWADRVRLPDVRADPRYAGNVPIPRDLLGDDEEVVVDLRPHWIFLLGPGALSVIAVVAALIVVAQFHHAPVGVPIALAVMVAVPVLWLLGRIARWRGISLIITNRRLMLRRGVFGQELIQLRLQRITDVHCSQTLFERLIGTGRLVVDVPGEEGQIVVEDVRAPRTVQRVISAQLDQLGPPGDSPVRPQPGEPAGGRALDDSTPPHGTRTIPARASAASPPNGGSASIPDQLIQLDDLRRRGIISEEEFAAKKTELFGRL